MPMPMYNYSYYPQGTQQQPMQIQNGGLISVRNEMEARNYPIAPGNSITFKDENSPYVYTKTMGFSQLDRPTFEKFRLVREEAQNAPLQAQSGGAPIDTSDFVLKSDFEAFRTEFDALKKSLEAKKDE